MYHYFQRHENRPNYSAAARYNTSYNRPFDQAHVNDIPRDTNESSVRLEPYHRYLPGLDSDWSTNQAYQPQNFSNFAPSTRQRPTRTRSCCYAGDSSYPSSSGQSPGWPQNGEYQHPCHHGHQQNLPFQTYPMDSHNRVNQPQLPSVAHVLPVDRNTLPSSNIPGERIIPYYQSGHYSTERSTHCRFPNPQNATNPLNAANVNVQTYSQQTAYPRQSVYSQQSIARRPERNIIDDILAGFESTEPDFPAHNYSPCHIATTSPSYAPSFGQSTSALTQLTQFTKSSELSLTRAAKQTDDRPLSHVPTNFAPETDLLKQAWDLAMETADQSDSRSSYGLSSLPDVGHIPDFSIYERKDLELTSFLHKEKGTGFNKSTGPLEIDESHLSLVLSGSESPSGPSDLDSGNASSPQKCVNFNGEDELETTEVESAHFKSEITDYEHKDVVSPGASILRAAEMAEQLDYDECTRPGASKLLDVECIKISRPGVSEIADVPDDIVMSAMKAAKNSLVTTLSPVINNSGASVNNICKEFVDNLSSTLTSVASVLSFDAATTQTFGTKSMSPVTVKTEEQYCSRPNTPKMTRSPKGLSKLSTPEEKSSTDTPDRRSSDSTPCSPLNEGADDLAFSSTRRGRYKKTVVLPPWYKSPDAKFKKSPSTSSNDDSHVSELDMKIVEDKFAADQDATLNISPEGHETDSSDKKEDKVKVFDNVEDLLKTLPSDLNKVPVIELNNMEGEDSKSSLKRKLFFDEETNVPSKAAKLEVKVEASLARLIERMQERITVNEEDEQRLVDDSFEDEESSEYSSHDALSSNPTTPRSNRSSSTADGSSSHNRSFELGSNAQDDVDENNDMEQSHKIAEICEVDKTDTFDITYSNVDVKLEIDIIPDCQAAAFDTDSTHDGNIFVEKIIIPSKLPTKGEVVDDMFIKMEELYAELHADTDQPSTSSATATAESENATDFIRAETIKVEPTVSAALSKGDFSKFEKETRDKKSAFISEELDDYLTTSTELKAQYLMADEKINQRGRPKKFYQGGEVHIDSSAVRPDLDIIDGIFFLSFGSEEALSAHLNIENDPELMAKHVDVYQRLRYLNRPEAVNLASSDRRIIQLKKKMIRYNKILGKETRKIKRREITVNKSRKLQKTNDPTQVKGWKDKFVRDAEEEDIYRYKSGKIHWRTEERLLKVLSLNKAKELGISLKKRRRKWSLLSHKKSRGKSPEESEIMEVDLNPSTSWQLPYMASTSSGNSTAGSSKTSPHKRTSLKPGEGCSKRPRLWVQDALSDEEIPNIGEVNKMLNHYTEEVVSGFKVPRPRKAAIKAFSSTKSLRCELLTTRRVLDALRTLQSPLSTGERFESTGECDDTARCDKPGCRYGCVCHLCGTEDTGAPAGPTALGGCMKEYCRLGCICDSLNSSSRPRTSCKQPQCRFICKCRDEYKPDLTLPRLRDKRNRRPVSNKYQDMISWDHLHGVERKMHLTPRTQRDYERRKLKVAPVRLTLRDGVDDPDYSPLPSPLQSPSAVHSPARPSRPPSNNVANIAPVPKTTFQAVVGRDKKFVMSVSEPPLKARDEKDPVIVIVGPREGCLFTSCARTWMYTAKHRRCRCPRDQPARYVLDCKSSDCPHQQYRKLRHGTKKADTADFASADVPSFKEKKAPLSEEQIKVKLAEMEESISQTRERIRRNGTEQVRPSAERPAPELKAKAIAERRPSDDKSCIWNTQMMLLQPKGRKDDPWSNKPQLLEIRASCKWDDIRLQILGFVAQKLKNCDYPPVSRIVIGRYVVEILPKSDQPTKIPAHLQSTLPGRMFSIRIAIQTIVAASDFIGAQKADVCQLEAGPTDIPSSAVPETKVVAVKREPGGNAVPQDDAIVVKEVGDVKKELVTTSDWLAEVSDCQETPTVKFDLLPSAVKHSLACHLWPLVANAGEFDNKHKDLVFLVRVKAPKSHNSRTIRVVCSKSAFKFESSLNGEAVGEEVTCEVLEMTSVQAEDFSLAPPKTSTPVMWEAVEGVKSSSSRSSTPRLNTNDSDVECDLMKATQKSPVKSSDESMPELTMEGALDTSLDCEQTLSSIITSTPVLHGILNRPPIDESPPPPPMIYKEAPYNSAVNEHHTEKTSKRSRRKEKQELRTVGDELEEVSISSLRSMKMKEEKRPESPVMIELPPYKAVENEELVRYHMSNHQTVKLEAADGGLADLDIDITDDEDVDVAGFDFVTTPMPNTVPPTISSVDDDSVEVVVEDAVVEMPSPPRSDNRSSIASPPSNSSSPTTRRRQRTRTAVAAATDDVGKVCATDDDSSCDSQRSRRENTNECDDDKPLTFKEEDTIQKHNKNERSRRHALAMSMNHLMKVVHSVEKSTQYERKCVSKVSTINKAISLVDKLQQEEKDLIVLKDKSLRELMAYLSAKYKLSDLPPPNHEDLKREAVSRLSRKFLEAPSSVLSFSRYLDKYASAIEMKSRPSPRLLPAEAKSGSPGPVIAGLISVSSGSFSVISGSGAPTGRKRVYSVARGSGADAGEMKLGAVTATDSAGSAGALTIGNARSILDISKLQPQHLLRSVLDASQRSGKSAPSATKPVGVLVAGKSSSSVLNMAGKLCLSVVSKQGEAATPGVAVPVTTSPSTNPEKSWLMGSGNYQVKFGGNSDECPSTASRDRIGETIQTVPAKSVLSFVPISSVPSAIASHSKTSAVPQNAGNPVVMLNSGKTNASGTPVTKSTILQLPQQQVSDAFTQANQSDSSLLKSKRLCMLRPVMTTGPAGGKPRVVLVSSADVGGKPVTASSAFPPLLSTQQVGAPVRPIQPSPVGQHPFRSVQLVRRKGGCFTTAPVPATTAGTPPPPTAPTITNTTSSVADIVRPVSQVRTMLNSQSLVFVPFKKTSDGNQILVPKQKESSGQVSPSTSSQKLLIPVSLGKETQLHMIPSVSPAPTLSPAFAAKPGKKSFLDNSPSSAQFDKFGDQAAAAELPKTVKKID